MESRLISLKIATAILYAGPLLAGMTGHGLASVAVFTAIFVLWLVVMRPRDWPRSLTGWSKSDIWVGAAANIVAQALLVVLSFAIGRGLAGVTGTLGAVPTALPFVISFMAIPLSRLIWNPSNPVEAGAFVAHAVSRMTFPRNTAAEDDRAMADAMTGPLTQLLPDTTPEVLEQHLTAMAPHATPRALTESLIAHAGEPGAGKAVKTALVLQATNPDLALAVQPVSAPAAAFHAARGDATLIALFAPRAEALIAAHPVLWPAFPGSGELRQAAASADATAAQALTSLADTLDRLAPNNPLEQRPA